MSERTLQHELFTEREALEALSPEQLVDLVLRHGETIGTYERTMSLAAEILEGYGTSMEDELAKRERETNGKT